MQKRELVIQKNITFQLVDHILLPRHFIMKLKYCFKNKPNLETLHIIRTLDIPSRKYFRTKVNPDLHQTYSKNEGNLVLNDKKWKFLHKIIYCGDVFESSRGEDCNR